MYAKGTNYVTYFTEENAKHTDKVFYGRVSEAIKLSDAQIERNGDGNKYQFESWSARFVGKALDKVKGLEDKASIILTEWNARNQYNKEKKCNYPYLMIMDFDIPESK